MDSNGKKRRKRHKRGGRGQQARAQGNYQQQLDLLSQARLPRAYQRLSPYPPEMQVRCTYEASVELFSGVNSWATKDFVVNDVRNPDRAITEAAYGYDFWSQVYRLFRVTKVEVKYIIVNDDGVPASAAFVLNDTQPSTLIASYDAAKKFSTVGYTTGPRQVGIDTGNSSSPRMTYKCQLGNVVGNNLTYMAEASYGGTDAASPGQSIWGTFIGYVFDAVTPFPNGLAIQATFIFSTRFYSMRPV
jgi:hypothetical protein